MLLSNTLNLVRNAASIYASHRDTPHELADLGTDIEDRGHAAYKRVPHATTFAKLPLVEKVAAIEAVQRELDYLIEGVRSGAIAPNHRGRGAALRDLRDRQKRLNKLAEAFGFRRRWRMHVRAVAVSRPLELDRHQ